MSICEKAVRHTSLAKPAPYETRFFGGVEDSDAAPCTVNGLWRRLGSIVSLAMECDGCESMEKDQESL